MRPARFGCLWLASVALAACAHAPASRPDGNSPQALTSAPAAPPELPVMLSGLPASAAAPAPASELTAATPAQVPAESAQATNAAAVAAAAPTADTSAPDGAVAAP